MAASMVGAARGAKRPRSGWWAPAVGGAGILRSVRSWLPALLLAVPLACDRPDEAAQAQALQAATEELAAARTAFEADRAAMKEELAALRESVDAVNAKLELLAALRPARSVETAELPLLPPLGEPTPRIEFDDAALAAAVRCESETRCTIDHAFLETLRINPGSLARQARIVPKQTDGTIEGFKLYGIRPGSVFKAVGIKNGDLVRSVNGMALGSMEKLLEVFAKLRHATTYTFELDRRGTPLTLTIDVIGGPAKP